MGKFLLKEDAMSMSILVIESRAARELFLKAPTSPFEMD